MFDKKAWSKEYNKKNAKKHQAYRKEYNATHVEQKKEYNDQWKKDNSDKINKWSLDHYYKNKEKRNAYALDYIQSRPLYSTWLNMKQRCNNATIKCYKHYGGRGITVCPQWINDYKQFEKDMGPKPGPKYSIDRIDVDGNYEPSNCRWSTITEQNLNRRF